MFGKPRQLKKLEVSLLAAQAIFGMYESLPPDKQRLVMKNNPASLAKDVRKAVLVGSTATFAGFHNQG
jgi:hypothetical protein